MEGLILVFISVFATFLHIRVFISSVTYKVKRIRASEELPYLETSHGVQ